MSKLNSEAFLVCLILTLGGCSALQVATPEEGTPQIRASMTIMAMPSRYGSDLDYEVARPLTDSLEEAPQLEWIDWKRSSLILSCSDSNGKVQNLNGKVQNLSQSIYSNEGLKYAGNGNCFDPYSTIRSVHGTLRWNASTPFSLAQPPWSEDSFDLVPQQGEIVRFRDGILRGAIELRWPRLARATNDSLQAWSKRPDSLMAWQADWERLCAGRNQDPRVDINPLGDSSSRYTYAPLDTAALRLLMVDSASVRVALQPRDTIWLPVERNRWISIEYPVAPLHPVIASSRTSLPTYAGGFLSTRNRNWYSSKDAYLYLPHQTQWVYYWIDHQYKQQDTAYSYRTMIQIAGTCPAFAQWYTYGSGTRQQAPIGNVAPFDGYFCHLQPDTLSFPQGTR